MKSTHTSPHAADCTHIPALPAPTFQSARAGMASSSVQQETRMKKISPEYFEYFDDRMMEL
jgi:hypothetical protein